MLHHIEVAALGAPVAGPQGGHNSLGQGPCQPLARLAAVDIIVAGGAAWGAVGKGVHVQGNENVSILVVAHITSCLQLLNIGCLRLLRGNLRIGAAGHEHGSTFLDQPFLQLRCHPEGNSLLRNPGRADSSYIAAAVTSIQGDNLALQSRRENRLSLGDGSLAAACIAAGASANSRAFTSAACRAGTGIGSSPLILILWLRLRIKINGCTAAASSQVAKVHDDAVCRTAALQGKYLVIVLSHAAFHHYPHGRCIMLGNPDGFGKAAVYSS